MSPSKVTAHENESLEFECGHKPGCKHRITQDGDDNVSIEDVYGVPGPGDGPVVGGTTGGDPGSPGSGPEGSGEEKAGTEAAPQDPRAEEKAGAEGKTKTGRLRVVGFGFGVPER